MLALAWLLSGTDPSTLADPSTWQQFGVFGIVFVVMTILGGGSILWLLRDRARLVASLAAADARERTLYDRIIEQGATLAPVLERNTRALDRAEARHER